MTSMTDRRGLSFVTLMIIIAISALMLSLISEEVMRRNMAQNESDAQTTLRLISTALENYAKDNRGAFPEDISVLTKTTPVYLDKNYIVLSPLRGYIYNCPTLNASGYSCQASPVKCDVTGKAFYTISTGGVFVSRECNKKE